MTFKKWIIRSHRASGLFWLAMMMLCIVIIQCGQKTAPEGKWIPLFNGENLDGWTVKFSGYEAGDNVRNTFRVEDGILKVAYDQYENFDDLFGHLYTNASFSRYRLRAEYRFTGEQVPGGPSWGIRNNGLMLHSQSAESMKKNQDFPVSVEVQLLGGNGSDDRPTGNVCTPGTHIVMNGELTTQHCINSSSKTFHGDQWVTVEVEVFGSDSIRHYINGELVLAYEQTQYDDGDETAIPFIMQGDKLLSKGHIAIQAESHATEFRKIEIMEIGDNEK